MKSLEYISFVFILAMLVNFGQNQLTEIECPFPEGTTETPTETRCNEFSACQWTDLKCHMSNDNGATYSLNGNYTFPNGITEFYFSKTEPYLTLFGSDVKYLTMQVVPHEDYHLQIKITDRFNERYEVPISLNLPSTSGAAPQYGLHILDPFGFEIRRSGEEKPLLSTVGPLTYEDQFIQLTFNLSSKYLYGIGESSHLTFQHPFEVRTTFPVWPRPQGYTEEPVNLMGQHPYFMVIDDETTGTAFSVLFLNSNPMESSTFLLDDGSPALTLRTIGGIIDLHIFLGPYPEDLNQQFVQMIGLPAMPPYFYLGFQLSRYGYNSTDYVRAVLQRNREAGIPQDIQTCDINYMDNYRIFTYDHDNWGDLPQFAEELHDDNLYLTLILDPPLAIDWDNYPPAQRGKDADAYIKWGSELLIPSDQEPSCEDYMVGYMWPNNKTVYPDFLNPETLNWWASEVVAFHQEINFDTIWIDMNEPSNFGTNMDRPVNYPTNLPDWSLKCPDNRWDTPPYPTMTVRITDNASDRISDGTICMSGVQSDGNKTFLHYDVHSLYGLTHAKASFQGVRDIFPDTRSMTLSRATYLGQGQYGAHWLGDNHSTWSHMKLSIVGILEFSMFGIPLIGADICGHFDEPSPELCTRWTQLGAFYTFSRNHNNEGNRDQDPASWDEEYVQIQKEALLIRYTLLPYLYTLLYRASTDGSSVIRPLFNVFPGDTPALSIDDQFMWGSGLMVAPVVEEGATTRDVYFPKGKWYDYNSGMETANTSQILSVSAPLEIIPLYLHGGIIVPAQEPAMRTDISRQNAMKLLVALDENFAATGELFWDDGTNMNLNANEAQLSSFTFADNSLIYDIEFGSASNQGLAFDQVIIYGYNEGNPISVEIDGNLLEPSEWVFDAAIKSLTINLNASISDPFRVDISCCQ